MTLPKANSTTVQPGNTGFLRPAWAYVAIGLTALATTTWYTGDLEMAWLAAMLFVPALALIVGAVFAALARVVARASGANLLAIVAFSVVLYSGLMVEEMAVGLIRHAFDAYTQRLAAAERAAPYHEVALGEDRVLYFSTVTDDVFRLNFTYQDETTVSREQLVALARHWLASHDYHVADLKLFLSPPSFRKTGFILRHPGEVSVAAQVMDGPPHDGRIPSTVYLRLGYESGFSFTERAWAYGP